LADKLAAQGVDSVETNVSIDVVAAAVQTEHPDLRPHAAPDGTATILFTDIEDSTAAAERLGDRRWMEVLRAHNAVVRGACRAHGGFEVKSSGDGFMLAFSSARRAIDCAVAIQQGIAAGIDGEPLRVRIGLHTGEVMRDGGDYFGHHVNLAARVAAAASGGQILVSSIVRELTASAGDLVFDDGRNAELKGIADAHRVYTLAWS
jgi:class 3 adenylate cyclase